MAIIFPTKSGKHAALEWKFDAGQQIVPFDHLANRTDAVGLRVEDPGTTKEFTVQISDPGPNSSTGVLVTNILPIGATYVSAVASQGTCTEAGGVVTASLGTIGALTNATVTITVLPTIAGLPLTNSVSVTRNESDSNLSDNSAVSIVIPTHMIGPRMAIREGICFYRMDCIRMKRLIICGRPYYDLI